MDNTQRFTSRSDVYARFRPHYPAEVADILGEECGLQSAHVVADIGSGTGFLTEVFLRNGNRVFGVEPNDAMRHAGEEFLQSWPNFTSVIGRAEATELPGQSVDFIMAAAAFHWFDHGRALPEFQRILKPVGWLVRVANRRRSDLGGMMKAMDDLMKEYRSGNDPDRHSRSEEALNSFYGPSGSATRTCANAQVLDLPGVCGLLLSHSSIPLYGENSHDEMISALRMAFEEHQIDGRVTLQYETRLTFGRLVR